MIFRRIWRTHPSMIRSNNCFRMSVLLTVVVLATVSSSQPSGQQDEVWDVSSVVAVVQDSGSRPPVWLLWVGLKNKSDSARLICLGAWAYTFQDPEDPRIGAEGSTHTCRTVQSFGLVLAGQTRFVAIPVGPVEARFESANFCVRLSLSESQFAQARERRQFQLSWEGTVEEALRAGHRLLNLSLIHI